MRYVILLLALALNCFGQEFNGLGDLSAGGVPVVGGGGGPTTPPTFVAQAQDSSATYGGLGVNLSVGTESSRLLVFVVALYASAQNPTISGVTFDSVALVDSGLGIVWDGSGNGIAVYYLVNPHNTTAHPIVSGSQTSLTQITTWTAYFSGAAQSSTVASAAQASGNSGTASITVSSGAGKMVIDAATGAAFQTMVAHSNRTAGYQYMGGNTASTSYLIPGVGSSVMDWTESSSAPWIEIGVCINGL